jgi:hypothetical protein
MADFITENGAVVAAAGVLFVVGMVSCCGGEKDSTPMPEVGGKSSGKPKKTAESKETTKQQAPKKEQSVSSKGNDDAKKAVESSKAKEKNKPKAAAAAAAGTKEVVVEKDNSNGKKKRNNKKKKGSSDEKESSAEPAPKEVEEDSNEVVETVDEVAAPAPKKKVNKPQSPIEAGWTRVELPKKEKKVASTPSAPSAPAQPVVPAEIPKAAEEAPVEPAEVKPTQPNTTVSIDPKKLGIVIGPKGSTMKRIEEISKCRLRTIDQDPSIQAKSAHIRVEGPDVESVREACRLVTDLCSKGYSAKLEGGDFTESFVEISARSIPDLVGTGGAVIKALRDSTGAVVNMPPQKKLATGGSDKLVKVSIAGPKASVAAAKEAIHDILTKYKATLPPPLCLSSFFILFLFF